MAAALSSKHAPAMNDLERMQRMVEALRAWVEQERADLERTGRPPSQLYLRRARIAEYVAEPDFMEAVRELIAAGA